MATKLGDFFRNSAGIPAGKQPTDKPIIKPKEIELHEPPTLLIPTKSQSQPAPHLIVPAELPELGSETPKLISPAAISEQPVPKLIQPVASGFQAPPILLLPDSVDFQSPPVLSVPTVVPFEPPLTLLVPTVVPFEPPPVLSVPTVTPLEPSPVLSVPTVVPFEPPPTLLAPTVVPFEPPPALLVPGVVPFEPPPALLVPGVVPFEPPPTLLTPASVSFEPPPALLVPAVIPFEPPPALLVPGVVPFEPPPALLVPAVVPFEPPPTLLTPASVSFEPPPALLVPAVIPFEQAPNLLQPIPVHDIGGTKFYQPEALAAPWVDAFVHQLDYFKSTLPQSIFNLVQQALPAPGNIDPDLLPSTIFTKALNVANQRIQDLENKYGYNKLADVGNKVSSFIGGALGVNYRPDGAYESSLNAPSLENINQDFRNNPGYKLADLFKDDQKIDLKSKYTNAISDDPKYGLGNVATYRSVVDNNDGVMFASNDVQSSVREVYFPFYLTDLRPGKNGKFRTVFFPPMSLTVNENFAPSWNAQNFIGRVDPVATYQNTTRNIEVTFKMIALHPADLKIIYNKLKWLTAMVYPEYLPSMRYKSGPILKLRIGDILNASSNKIAGSADQPGVSGYLTSLNYNYDSIWELDYDWQVPRNIDVSFGFAVLHELPVGLLEGSFGAIGSIDAAGQYQTPQFTADHSFVQTSDSTTADSPYVDQRGFRAIGPSATDPQSSEGGA